MTIESGSNRFNSGDARQTALPVTSELKQFKEVSKLINNAIVHFNSKHLVQNQEVYRKLAKDINTLTKTIQKESAPSSGRFDVKTTPRQLKFYEEMKQRVAVMKEKADETQSTQSSKDLVAFITACTKLAKALETKIAHEKKQLATYVESTIRTAYEAENVLGEKLLVRSLGQFLGEQSSENRELKALTAESLVKLPVEQLATGIQRVVELVEKGFRQYQEKIPSALSRDLKSLDSIVTVFGGSQIFGNYKKKEHLMKSISLAIENAYQHHALFAIPGISNVIGDVIQPVLLRSLGQFRGPNSAENRELSAIRSEMISSVVQGSCQRLTGAEIAVAARRAIALITKGFDQVGVAMPQELAQWIAHIETESKKIEKLL